MHVKMCNFDLIKMYKCDFYYSSLAAFEPKAVDVIEVCYEQMDAQDYEEEHGHLINGLLLCDELGVLVGNVNTATNIKQGLYSSMAMVVEHMMR